MSDEKRLVEQFGVALVSAYVTKIDALFRHIREHDKGIDGEIELANSYTNQTPFIGVQIKCRSDIVFNSDNYTTIRVTDQNLRYWHSYGRPVILILTQKDNFNDLYWTRVDGAKDLNIKLSKSQKFTKQTRLHFEKINRIYNIKKAMNLELENIDSILNEIGENIADITKPIFTTIKEYKSFINDKNYKGAIKPLEVLDYLYNNEKLKYNLCICYFESSLYEKCIEYCEYNYSDKLKRMNSYIIKAYALNSLDNYTRATEVIYEAINIYGKKKELINALGLIEYSNGVDEKAYICLKEVAQNSNDSKLFFNFALTCCAMNECEEAIESYEQCIKLSYDDLEIKYDAYNNLGLLYKEIWRLEDSVDMFKKAIYIDTKKYLYLSTENCTIL